LRQNAPRGVSRTFHVAAAPRREIASLLNFLALLARRRGLYL
jgi:hypothetical protein